MKINSPLLEEFKNQKSKILVVTKYHDAEKTNEIIDYFSREDNRDLVVWFWENRVKSLKEKNLDREITHFIWNIQTKEIKYILKHCSFVHSVDDIKQILKMEEICSKSWNWVQIFLQINVDEQKDWWIKIEEIPKFLEVIWDLENVSLIGFSAIGKSEFSDEEKQKEFDLLKELRNKYLPNWLISAWTSLDYKEAIKNEIDIIRIWSKIYE